MPADIIAENFPMYVPRQRIARFLAQAHIFEKSAEVKGSIVECGVFQGGGLFTWAHLSSIFEPVNFHRKIIGFDTFTGFPNLTEVDLAGASALRKLETMPDTLEEILKGIEAYDQNRFIGHKSKIEVIKGDAAQTIPKYVKENPHLIVSMLYLDFDIYEPTLVALEHFVPRMPKGAIIAFDEINNPQWAGETVALMEHFNLNEIAISGFPYDPHLSYAQIGK